MLKNKYSNLGLGDEILTAQAETLDGLGFITDENIETVINGLEGSLKAIQKSNDKERTAKVKAERDRQKLEQEKKALEEKLKVEPLTEPIEKPLTRAEIEEMFKQRDEVEKQRIEQKRALETRSKFIADKVKELGIPEWRVKEGFLIKDDFDNDKIVEYLTGVKKNITTAGLEGKIGFPIDMDKQVSKEEADKIAKQLIR